MKKITKLTLTLMLFATLFLANSCSKSSSTPDAPVAIFSYTILNNPAPALVAFFNTSTNATTYNWDFGDNTSISTELNPRHTYASGGTYTVKLTARGDGGVNSISQTITIQSATSLQINVKDNLGNPVVGASVKLYSNLSDLVNKTNQVLTTQTTSSNGSVIFSPLNPTKYYWLVESGCQNNLFGSYTTVNSLTANVSNSTYTVISGTGTLVFNNTSSNPYDVYVNGTLQITNMAGGTTQSLIQPTGSYTIRVLQKSGYILTPTDKTYSGTISCGGSLVTIFP